MLQGDFRAKPSAFVEAAVSVARVMVAFAAISLLSPVLASVALRASIFDAAVLASVALRALIFAAVVLTP